VTLICDAGAFVALERNDRAMWRRLKAEVRAAQPPVSHGGVVAQVWRGGARQALLARALSAVEISGLDEGLGRKAGALLGRVRNTVGRRRGSLSTAPKSLRATRGLFSSLRPPREAAVSDVRG
jgi:hypothetical protein